MKQEEIVMTLRLEMFKKGITIKDIIARTGLSRPTISRVLNNHAQESKLAVIASCLGFDFELLKKK